MSRVSRLKRTVLLQRADPESYRTMTESRGQCRCPIKNHVRPLSTVIKILHSANGSRLPVKST
ncbi:hypothetical protein KIN20_003639 [Parelaphostrongylus tenuis]|uniref:Uncharacterized protein n=1 Tax=Parelaphostrongylus tenuis TaxID=148309 RepID=A0AAD5LZF8_PARTN|nr:hypothetical protein KIN20_003639 [Parelaphostrongylus tenuis]